MRKQIIIFGFIILFFVGLHFIISDLDPSGQRTNTEFFDRCGHKERLNELNYDELLACNLECKQLYFSGNCDDVFLNYIEKE